MPKGFRIRIWGDYALFSRPELKVERYSYDVPTPSALIGLLESIYWHPGLVYRIDRIKVIKPIKRISVRRNEIKSKLSAKNVLSSLENKQSRLFLDRSKGITQRMSTILTDVEYLVDFHFELNQPKCGDLTSEKVTAIISRRIEKGQCFRMTYFGCREFPAYFERTVTDVVSAYENSDDKDLGVMLHTIDYSDPSHPEPVFYHPIMRRGVIDVASYEVLR